MRLAPAVGAGNRCTQCAHFSLLYCNTALVGDAYAANVAPQACPVAKRTGLLLNDFGIGCWAAVIHYPSFVMGFGFYIRKSAVIGHLNQFFFFNYNPLPL